ncbi:MAG: non-ribosomal peptide synthetase, partial [Moorea sp. SIO4A1]|uniref:phosphopantetheine-binding protein n=1 Tax=Moorena sp. SIO4A1 TaxID=2607835 RepID=UPI00144B05BD
LFVMLGALPLTPNGKVDRKKLPNPNINNRANTEYVVPKTEIEQHIARVWQDVLQIEKVGIYDNFFEVGGNSLLLVQVSSKLQELFKMELQVVELLKYPNIYYLSQYLKSETPETKNLTEVREVRDSNLKEGKKNMQQRLERRQRHRSKNKIN